MPAHLTIERNHNYIENTFFLHFAIVVSAVNIAPNLKKKMLQERKRSTKLHSKPFLVETNAACFSHFESMRLNASARSHRLD